MNGYPLASMPELPRGKRQEHRIEIDAPAGFVWKYVEEVSRWPDWNPIYRSAEGSIRLGETLNLLVAIPGMKPRTIAVPVVQLVPEHHVQYGAPSLGGLVQAMRFVDVQPLAPDRCLVRNGEVMGGLVGRLLGPSFAPKIFEALRQMNEGLKAAAEAQWGKGGNAAPLGQT